MGRMNYKFEQLEQKQIQRECEEVQRKEQDEKKGNKSWRWVIIVLIAGAVIRLIYYIQNVLGA